MIDQRYSHMTASQKKHVERIARQIARGLGHNDDTGMEWERYIASAIVVLNENLSLLRPEMNVGPMELADRLEDRLNRDRFGKVDPWLGIRVGPGLCEDLIEAIAALRRASGDEMDDFIRAVLADNNPRTDEPYATVAKWARRLNRRSVALQEREVLQTIARTTFSGSEMGDDYMRGNKDAHSTCARMARAALNPGTSPVTE